jgi:quinol monooxygenase YgiN
MDEVFEAIPSEAPRQVLLPGRRSLLVRLTAKPGMRAALLAELNAYADGLSEEPGTEVFMVSTDPDNDSIVWLLEVFRDTAAEAAHRGSQGFERLMRAIPDILEDPPAVLRMDPLRLSLQEQVLVEDWML